MGHPEHPPAPLAGPALGHELLAGINGEAPASLPRLWPDIARGPQDAEPPQRTGAFPQQQGTALLGVGGVQKPIQNDEQAPIGQQLCWREAGHPDTLWGKLMAPVPRFMTETPVSSPDQDAVDQTSQAAGVPSTDGDAAGVNFSERYSEILGKVNQTLDQVDWSQMGRIGKSVGILLAVIIAQVLIKGVLDTINLLPIVPGLLELLGLVVVGQWSWKNLTTSEKRNAVVAKLQHLRQEYLG